MFRSKASSQIITTTRLELRPLAPADAPRIALLGGDWDVCSMTSRMPYPYTAEKALQWVEDLDDGEFVRGITLDGELIGICGYMPEDETSAEIGYWIGKPYWGQGFGTEAAKAIVRYCFKKVGHKVLYGGHFVDNPASAQVIKKLGFRLTGEEASWCEARRSHAPALRYALKRSVLPASKPWWWRK